MIPALLLTGFLGSGKTTALNGLMNARSDLRVGVIENEAGSEGVDGDLLEGAARVIEIAGGCACCTVRGALASALELLGERINDLDLVVVEASGIADPVPIVQAFQSHAVRSALRFAGIVCVIDAAAVSRGQSRPRVWDLQVRLANQIIMTKADLLSVTDFESVKSQITELAPQADLIESLNDNGFLGSIFKPGDASLPRELRSEDADPGHGFTAHSLRVPPLLNAKSLDRWLSDLLRRPGVFRVKGTVAIEGMRRRYVIQGTPELLELHPEVEPGRSRRNRLVVIGSHLDPDQLQSGLELCAKDPGMSMR